MFKKILAVLLVVGLILPVGVVMAGKGPGGGGGGGGGPKPTPTPGGGGSGQIPDTGTLYGDLYVILRDVNGVPIFDEHGCIQPISAVDGGTLKIYDSTGTTVLFETTAIAGEPFSLAFYTDATIELEVECELTEEMADWVMTVDFGRLNLGRAPDSVIAHAFDEAIKKFNSASEIKLDPAGRLVVTLLDAETGYPVDKTIDAPAEALALYIGMMTDGDWYTEDTTPIVKGGLPTGKGPPEGDGPSAEPRPVLNDTAIGHLEDLGFTNLGDDLDGGVVNTVRADASLNNDELLLAASLLAAAADKTGSITLDKVVYINFIYGINQLGSLDDGQAEPRNYFDFSGFGYNRNNAYQNRGSAECAINGDGVNDFGPSFVWVLQPEVGVDNHFVITCMDLLTYAVDPEGVYDQGNSVRYTYMTEAYTTVPFTYIFDSNVRGFAQAADDALQVIEYIHNYKLPEVLYP